MTVEELITELKKLDGNQDAIFHKEYLDGCYQINAITSVSTQYYDTELQEILSEETYLKLISEENVNKEIFESVVVLM